MSRPSPLTWILTFVNVAAAITVVLCTGYVAGLLDGQQTGQNVAVPHAEPVSETETRTQTAVSRDRRVIPNPHVGRGHHPVFDCSSMDNGLGEGPEGSLSIGELADASATYEGKAVAVQGRVVQAFPNIMGVNWFHICDEPNGRVLVASASQWVPPGHLVVVRGILTLDRNIADAYHFPLFIESAHLEGDAVVGGPSPTHGRAFDL